MAIIQDVKFSQSAILKILKDIFGALSKQGVTSTTSDTVATAVRIVQDFETLERMDETILYMKLINNQIEMITENPIELGEMDSQMAFIKEVRWSQSRILKALKDIFNAASKPGTASTTSDTAATAIRNTEDFKKLGRWDELIFELKRTHLTLFLVTGWDGRVQDTIPIKIIPRTAPPAPIQLILLEDGSTLLMEDGSTVEREVQMAKVSALTEVTALADTDEFLVNDGGISKRITAKNLGAVHRGALVTLAADQTATNYTTAAAVPFDEEAYDTDTIHDNSTNNTRLTVPTDVIKVQLSGNVVVTLTTAEKWHNLTIRKGGVLNYIGSSDTYSGGLNRTDISINISSPVLEVSAGEYFELFLRIETDTSVTVIDDRSWFAMEIIE